MGAKIGKENDVTVTPYLGSSIISQKQEEEMSATVFEPYYVAFYSGLEHSSDFRYIVASAFIGCVGSFFNFIGPGKGILLCLFSQASLTLNVVSNIQDASHKSKDKLDSSKSQMSYFGAISSIIDFECGTILFGGGSCYGDALDKSLEYFISTQGVQNGLEHASELKYAVIPSFALTIFGYHLTQTQLASKLKVHFYFMDILLLTLPLEGFFIGKDQSSKFLGVIPSIIDHQCDYILYKNAGCYGTLIDTLYENTDHIWGV
jgi:hypothetical protein